MDNYYTGKSNNRKLSNTSYVEFSSSDAASAALAALGGRNTKIKLAGTDVLVRRSITKKNRRRNWALRRAVELLKNMGVESVSIDFKKRCVVVGSSETVAFQQQQEDSIGSFLSPYEHLVIE